jgi:FAD/FMN-containing dehydrogenase
VLVPPERAWALRHAVTAALAAEGTVLGFDLSVPPSVLPTLRRAVRAVVQERAPGWQVADFGHWGDGGVHCNLVVGAPVALDADLAGSMRSAIYELVDRLGGSYSAEHGIGPLNSDWWRRHTPPAQQRLLAAFKQQVDPLGVLGHPGVPFA